MVRVGSGDGCGRFYLGKDAEVHRCNKTGFIAIRVARSPARGFHDGDKPCSRSVVGQRSTIVEGREAVDVGLRHTQRSRAFAESPKRNGPRLFPSQILPRHPGERRRAGYHSERGLQSDSRMWRGRGGANRGLHQSVSVSCRYRKSDDGKRQPIISRIAKKESRTPDAHPSRTSRSSIQGAGAEQLTGELSDASSPKPAVRPKNSRSRIGTDKNHQSNNPLSAAIQIPLSAIPQPRHSRNA